MVRPKKCEGQPLGSYYHKFKRSQPYGERGFDSQMTVTECRNCGIKVYRAPGPKSGRLTRRHK